MRSVSLFIFSLGLFLSLANSVSAAWSKPIQPPSTSTLTSIAVSADDATFVSSENTIYQEDAFWHSIWEMPIAKAQVTQLKTFRSLPNDLFILTYGGLFRGNQMTSVLSRVFFGKNEKENRILSFAIHPIAADFWLLGTEAGLFQTLDGGQKWSRVQPIGKEPVSVIVFSESFVLVGAGHFLYRTKDLESFKVVFKIASSPNESAALDEEFLAHTNVAVSFNAASTTKSSVWLATEQGVLESTDQGQSWQWLSESGLREKAVRDIVYDKITNRLFAATNRSIYAYKASEQQFQELYQGMTANRAFDLELRSGPKSKLLAVTSHGILEFPLGPTIHETPNILSFSKNSFLLHELLKKEPTARDIHQEVIHYNDVSNQKIKRWHRASKAKSLIPSFSFGKNFSEGNNIDLDRGSTTTPDAYIVGPNDTSESWDFDVRWDLGNALYSSAQTSIDSRSKSMVDFRHDLLSEATRLFYERRRLQMGLVFSPPPSATEHFAQLLRMDELTSLLDGMTGGYLSKRLEEIYKEYPGFGELWHFRGSTRIHYADQIQIYPYEKGEITL